MIAGVDGCRGRWYVVRSDESGGTKPGHVYPSFDSTPAVPRMRRRLSFRAHIVRQSQPRSRSIAVAMAFVALIVLQRDVEAQSTPDGTSCRAKPGAEAIPGLFARWIDEVWHQGRLDLVPQVIGPQYIRHEGSGTRTVTPAQYAEEIAATRRRLPDVRFIIHDCDAVGNRLWTRWTMSGTSAQSGQVVKRMGAQVYRIADSRLVETWMLMLPTDASWPDRATRVSTTRPAGIASELVGTWRLFEFWDRDSATAPKSYPYGEQPTGYFVYDPTGHVAIHIQKGPMPPVGRPGRGENWFRSASLEELRTTVGSFRAYFGTYSVDRDRGIVIHQVEGDSRALYTGTPQRRHFRLVGDSLIIGNDTTARRVLLRVR